MLLKQESGSLSYMQNMTQNFGVVDKTNIENQILLLRSQDSLKFYALQRVDIRRIGQIKVGDDILGNRTKIKVVKNKIAPPFRIAEFDIMYNEGISKTGDILDLAATHGIVEKSGAFYKYNGETIGQGRDKTKLYLKENPKVLAEIDQKVRNKVKESEQ